MFPIFCSKHNAVGRICVTHKKTSSVAYAISTRKHLPLIYLCAHIDRIWTWRIWTFNNLNADSERNFLGTKVSWISMYILLGDLPLPSERSYECMNIFRFCLELNLGSLVLYIRPVCYLLHHTRVHTQKIHQVLITPDVIINWDDFWLISPQFTKNSG